MSATSVMALRNPLQQMGFRKSRRLVTGISEGSYDQEYKSDLARSHFKA